MTPHPPILHLLCGKIASGKSSLASMLSQGETTVLIAEDDWLSALFGEEMTTGADYLRCSGKLQTIMQPHVSALLRSGVSVVLDFPANTVEQRRWLRNVIDSAGVDHQLHLLTTPDEVCLARLQARNDQGAHAFAATRAQFDAFARHFTPPTPQEGFNVIHHTPPE